MECLILCARGEVYGDIQRQNQHGIRSLVKVEKRLDVKDGIGSQALGGGLGMCVETRERKVAIT